MEKGNKQLSNTQLWRKAIRVAAGIDDGYVPVQIFDAVVKAGSQNSDEMTCVVDSCDSTCNALVVRYNLCISDGIVCVPDDDSVVTIAKTSFTDPYIVKTSDLISYDLVIGTSEFNLIDGAIFIAQKDLVAKMTGSLFSLKNDEQNLYSIFKDILNQLNTICQQLITPSNILTPTGAGQFQPDVVTEITTAMTNLQTDLTNLGQIMQ